MSDLIRLYTITEGPTDAVVIKALMEALGRRYTWTALQPEGEEKNRLNKLGPGALFECRPDPAHLLAHAGVTKSPEDFDDARLRLVKSWEHARALPEALRFERELAAVLP